jgi:hypothetical protein
MLAACAAASSFAMRLRNACSSWKRTVPQRDLAVNIGNNDSGAHRLDKVLVIDAHMCHELLLIHAAGM